MKGKLYWLEMLKSSPSILYESVGIKMEIIPSGHNPERNNMTLSYKQEEIFSVLQGI